MKTLFIVLSLCSLTYYTVAHDYCHLRPKVGPCRANIMAWYFHPNLKKCRIFYYGGCGGNANRFMSKQECEYKCGGQHRHPSATQTVAVLASCGCSDRIKACQYINQASRLCNIDLIARSACCQTCGNCGFCKC